MYICTLCIMYLQISKTSVVLIKGEHMYLMYMLTFASAPSIQISKTSKASGMLGVCLTYADVC